MIIVETKDDIVVIDAGFQFVTEESNAPGINYILPNTQYLEERKHKIRALIVTHGHLDHIGGIPFIIERIGNQKSIPIPYLTHDPETTRGIPSYRASRNERNQRRRVFYRRQYAD